MNKPMLITLAVSATAAAACGHEAPEPVRVQTMDVATMTVASTSLPELLPVDGTVQGAERASLSTRLMARVTALEIEVGDRVRRGQVLIRLGTDDIAANRAKARAAVQAAHAMHAEAERHAARMEALYEQDAVAKVQRDQALLQLTQAASQVAMAEAGLREVETADAYATVRAPFAATVVRRHVDAGDLAAPGMPLVELEGAGAREVVFSVPADVAAALEPGDTVSVRGAGGREAEAPITAVAGGADPMTRTVEVRATVPAEWPTGVAVTALVPSGTRPGIAIPEAAVIRRGQLTGVRVLTDDGPLLRWIRLGRTLPASAVPETDEVRVEVLSGLAAGERIVL